MRNKSYIPILILISIILMNCTETFIIETENFESALVVEATITNELKFQNIKLSKTIRLEEFEQLIEQNAQVKVTDNTNNTYNFSQNSEGIYVSDIAFQAMPNVLYTLEITTSNGKQYVSTATQLSPISQIDNLYAELVDDTKKGPGIQVFVDSDNATTNAKYFRYEYDETYKIVAPYHSDYKAVLTNYEYDGYIANFDTEFVLREQEEKICFISKKNTEIIQTTTSNLNDNTVERLPIRFIATNNSIIRERYSILVKQYTQSIEAFTFYKTLSLFGNNESILSENQPGYIQSNVTNINTNERVVGFFEVSYVSNKRTYFNYSNFDLSQPNYFYECDVRELDYNGERDEIYRLLTRFEEYNYNYSIIEVPASINSIWKIVSPECGDCTTFGSNIQPDFWED